MYRAGRTVWGLVAVGAATAVGLTTHDAGFVVITFIGSLMLPRILGLAPHRGRPGFGGHGMAWGRHCAGASRGGPDTPASTSAPQSV